MPDDTMEVNYNDWRLSTPLVVMWNMCEGIWLMENCGNNPNHQRNVRRTEDSYQQPRGGRQGIRDGKDKPIVIAATKAQAIKHGLAIASREKGDPIVYKQKGNELQKECSFKA